MDLEKLQTQTEILIDDVIKQADLKKGQIFVLGLSSSEVNGGLIGHNSSAEIGQVIVKTIYDKLTAIGVRLAVQGCEHLNRALLVERDLADQKDLEIVSVVPQLNAGGVVKSQPMRCFRIQSKLNISQLKLVLILATQPLACTLNTFRFLFVLLCAN